MFKNRVATAERRHARGAAFADYSVREWGERWLSIYKKKTSARQQAHYKAKLELDIYPAIGDLPMLDVRASHLNDILNAYENGSKSTVSKIKNAITQLFNAAYEEGFYEVNPASNLLLPEVTERKRRPLTNFEKIIAFEVAKTHPRGPYIMTMMFCGLRRGEDLVLRMSNVNLEKRRMKIVETLSLDKNQGTVKDGAKTEAGTRMVPIPDMLYPFLVKQCEGKRGNSIVFPYGSKSGYATDKASWLWWKSFKRQCHLLAGAKTYRNAVLTETSPFDDAITPHYFRHTYATDLYAAGLDEKALKFFLGHKMPEVTEIYRQMGEVAFSRAAALIDKYYSESCLSPYPDKRTQESLIRCARCQNVSNSDNNSSFDGIDW
jgi:integrase